MKFSLNLIKQYVDLTDISLELFSEKMSLAGFEIENMRPCAQANNIVIGQVVECSDHPDSDHLHVTQVNIGTEVLQIVCGAPNVKKGQKVIVCLEGAFLPAKNLLIKKSVVRNVPSNGMIASLLELGVDEKYLNDEQKSGIEVLPEDALIGNKNVLEYLNLDDTIIEINVTPNRSDVFAIHNLAKEIGAIFDRKVTIDDIELLKTGNNKFTCDSMTSDCPYFSITEINDIKIKPSPKWLVDILHKHDIKAINNVVDIGNYVTLLTGQPLHMYDANKLKSKNYVVKNNLNEEVKALDDKVYQIIPNDLVVTNVNPVCIAGVIGDDSSKIDDNTKNIALEAALFNGNTILNSCKRFNVLTVAATNYSKKAVDETRPIYAASIACKLLKELADAQYVSDLTAYDARTIKEKEITIDIDYINQRLHTTYSLDDVSDVFERLDFKFVLKGNQYQVKIPNYRHDVEIKEDLLEEIVRLIGFDTVPYVMPENITEKTGLSEKQNLKRKIKNYLLDLGLTETLSYTLINKANLDYYDFFDNDEAICLLHPLTIEKSHLRKNMIYSMLNTVSYNQARGSKEVAIFEISNTYDKVKHEEKLAIAISNSFNKTKWLENKEVDFYLIKGIVEGILSMLGIEPSRYTFENLKKYYPTQNIFHPKKSAVLKVNGQLMAVMGQIHPTTKSKENIDDCVYLELNLSKFFDIKTSKSRYQAVSKFPTISRDIALVVKKDIPVNDILKIIKKVGGPSINSLEVFDVYTGEHVEKGYKSIAINMTFIDFNKTLVESEINELFSKVYQACQKEFNAQIRK